MAEGLSWGWGVGLGMVSLSISIEINWKQVFAKETQEKGRQIRHTTHLVTLQYGLFLVGLTKLSLWVGWMELYTHHKFMIHWNNQLHLCAA